MVGKEIFFINMKPPLHIPGIPVHDHIYHCIGQIYIYCAPTFKAAESVSFRNYCMWIFLFYKKLHMSKLSIKVELIP